MPAHSTPRCHARAWRMLAGVNQDPDPEIQQRIPARRWSQVEAVGHALVFLPTGPACVTGEIKQLNGGRHLL